MKVLAFSGVQRIRAAGFEERSALPCAAACLVASSMRERLSALLAAPVTLRVLEPLIPTPSGWQAIARGARFYRLRGSAADAALVVRDGDAAVLASAAFGETIDRVTDDHRLSPIERDVLNRAMSSLAGTLNAICGDADAGGLERASTLDGFETYFEVLIERPVVARIGVALSKDPSPEPQGALLPESLNEVRLPAAVRLELGSAAAGTLARLAPGEIMPILSSSGFRGSLHVAGRTLARGACGIHNGRYALCVEG
jgi:hypothetical protein